ncbi:DUF4384 domain-containing protein [Rhodovulum sp. 12E13]|uniref:DUF4384 domain-containing protein n=1 Tax=Rhodovulum sp. 12E13 TaxID=2203891 RepID=UPI000E133BA1|nr:DUF4384 domain-containing protein [Rhodovulum sp. 12E13]RDC75293.1 DUF4384 domain-containing protein [Rhodovulum sp. 12E13]
MTGRVRALLLGSLGLLAAGAAGAEDRAVVVGIDSYPGVFLPRALSSASADAERMRDHLVTDLGFAPGAVTLLTDEAATSGAIVDALLDDLVGGTGPGDRAFFYFAGLGGRIAAAGGIESDGYEEFLLAHGDGDPFALIPEGALVEIFDRIGDREVSLVIDASMTAPPARAIGQGDAVAARAAAFGQLPRAASRNVSDAAPGPVGAATFGEGPFGTGAASRNIWVAAAPSQVAWETPEGGVFTDTWIEGVSDGAADMNGNGVVTNAELLVHMREVSEAWCAGNASCRATGLGLTPDFSGDVLGQVVALSATAAPQEAGPTSAPAATVPPGGDQQAAAPQALAAAPGRDTVQAFVTDLFAASNAAGLTIDISTDGPLRLGDTVSFTVTSERAGTLLLLDVNPEGDLFQIFPSRLSLAEAAAVSAGEAVRIPGPYAPSGRPIRIRVTEPAGDGMLLALLVEGEAPVFETILPRNLEFAPIPNATQYLYELVQSLLEMQVGPGGNAAVDWSAAYLPYSILR